MTLNIILPLLIVLSAILPSLLIFATREDQVVMRRSLSFAANIICLILISVLIHGVYEGQVFETRLPLLPDIDFVLNADALSLLFVSLSGLLWLLTTIYAIGYLEGAKHRSRFFGFFSLCVAATLGIALAGNLITFVIFYELLTLATYPLVVHKGNAASLRAGRIYLAYTMFGGALLLAGVAWLKAIAGPLDFTATGFLSTLDFIDPFHLQCIFVLLIAGLGVKAALVPFHGWLPIAMAAPAPVSALLHAVAVVKAGAFGIVRVVYDVYGIEYARELGLTIGLAAIAAITIVYGSLLALKQDDIKKRLAYSTVSQVSYIALGTAIAGPIATIGGIAHLVHQGVMKITLFFCAGNLAETLGIHKVSELNGVGRRMPLTMMAFTIAALGMIGLPPIAGFVSKWHLGTGAIEVGNYWVLGVLALSSMLNALYLLPILHAAWFKPATTDWAPKKHFFETHWMLLLPPVITAGLALIAGIFANASFSPLSWVKLIAAREYGLEQAVSVSHFSSDQPLLWWVIGLPLILSCGLLLRKTRAWCARLAPLAALPALGVATLLGPSSATYAGVFFGSHLSFDQNSQLVLLLAALLWFIAAIYGSDYLANDKQRHRYTFYFLTCMSGSFGLILSYDLFGFITFFTLMSFSAYGLIVHTGSSQALQAGKTYIQWVILGELLLFAAMVGLAISSGSTTLYDMRLALQPAWVSWFLAIGFGVKAGLLGVHFWLPRAHPVAPIPASAVLSGLMVKAGLLGWLRFLPMGDVALTDLGTTLMILGIAAAFLAVAVGLIQQNVKALLAYSTVSQMGILTAGIGAGLYSPSQWSILSVTVLLYALHHGLAKAALFMSVGLTSSLSSRAVQRGFVYLLIIIPAVALAGLPLTSGALAKYALKSSISDIDWLIQTLPFTAIGTTLLMLRFFDLFVKLSRATAVVSTKLNTRCLSVTLLVLCGLFAPYLVSQSEPFVSSALSLHSISMATWPFLTGVLIFFVARLIFAKLEHLKFPIQSVYGVIEWTTHALTKSMPRFGLKARTKPFFDFPASLEIQNKTLAFVKDVNVRLSFLNTIHPGVTLMALLLCFCMAAFSSAYYS